MSGSAGLRPLPSSVIKATSTGTLFELLFEDWGKLSMLGQALGTGGRQKLALELESHRERPDAEWG